MKMTCPRCGSEEAHKTNLHECLNGGTPMRCSDCYNTWCVVRFEVEAIGGIEREESVFDRGGWIQDLLKSKIEEERK